MLTFDELPDRQKIAASHAADMPHLPGVGTAAVLAALDHAVPG